MAESSPVTDTRPTVSVLDIIRYVVMLTAFVSLALWGAIGFVFPWNLVFGVGAPLLAIIVWALFISPKAVLRVHPFVRAFVELLIFVAATIAWWSMGQTIIGIAFAVVAVASGLVAGRRALV